MWARTSAVMVVVSDWRGVVMLPFMRRIMRERGERGEEEKKEKEKEETIGRGSRCFGLEGQITHCVRLMHGRRERCGTFRCVDALLFMIAVSVLSFPKAKKKYFYLTIVLNFFYFFYFVHRSLSVLGRCAASTGWYLFSSFLITGRDVRDHHQSSRLQHCLQEQQQQRQ